MSDVLWLLTFIPEWLIWLFICLIVFGWMVGGLADRGKKEREDKLNRDIERDARRLREAASLPNPHHIQDPSERARAVEAWNEYHERWKK